MHCDMTKECLGAVTHIDSKGYCYCAKHGEQRKSSGNRCRKLKPAELAKLAKGETISRY